MAQDVTKLSPISLPPTVPQQQSFVIVVADNFDLNIGILHGENSIHILNRIIVQTPLNDELKSEVNDCVKDLCASAVFYIGASVLPPPTDSDTPNSTMLTTTNVATNSKPYSPFTDHSYRHERLAYGLMKFVYDGNNIFEKIVDKQVQVNLPLLFGFFATYLPYVQRPISRITFIPPINQDPNSLSTSQLCLQSTKASSIDSGYQREAVVVVDKKIYSNCVKVRFSFNLSFDPNKKLVSFMKTCFLSL